MSGGDNHETTDHQSSAGGLHGHDASAGGRAGGKRNDRQNGGRNGPGGSAVHRCGQRQLVCFGGTLCLCQRLFQRDQRNDLCARGQYDPGHVRHGAGPHGRRGSGRLSRHGFHRCAGGPLVCPLCEMGGAVWHHHRHRRREVFAGCADHQRTDGGVFRPLF